MSKANGSKQTVIPVADAEATFAARWIAATAPVNVRFTPESGHSQRLLGVRFVPEADIARMRAHRVVHGDQVL
jgi:hypothetical protein